MTQLTIIGPRDLADYLDTDVFYFDGIDGVGKFEADWDPSRDGEDAEELLRDLVASGASHIVFTRYQTTEGDFASLTVRSPGLMSGYDNIVDAEGHVVIRVTSEGLERKSFDSWTLLEAQLQELATHWGVSAQRLKFLVYGE